MILLVLITDYVMLYDESYAPNILFNLCFVFIFIPQPGQTEGQEIM